MDDGRGIGEIIETERSGGKLTFEWRIPNFFQSVQEVSYNIFGMPEVGQFSEIPGSYSSPPLSFCNECWFMDLQLDWLEFEPGRKRIDLDIFRCKYGLLRTVYFTFAIKALDGVEQKINGEMEFGEEGPEYGMPEFWLLSDLRRRKSRLVPGNVLTIIGVFQSDEPRISLPNRCKDVTFSQKSLLVEKSPPDFILKVGNREYRVHKHILSSKSEYFASMFRQEWSENTKGEARFDDIEEDALDSMLKFIYTGEVKNVQVESVCDIYIAAHKFLFEDLKKFCAESMTENMGPDIVWESLAIAKIYEEKDLEKCALDYLDEGDEVKYLCMKEWKQFEQNHPSIAAEVRKKIHYYEWDDESDSDDSVEK